jgi:hypothetical protein
MDLWTWTVETDFWHREMVYKSRIAELAPSIAIKTKVEMAMLEDLPSGTLSAKELYQPDGVNPFASTDH